MSRRAFLGAVAAAPLLPAVPSSRSLEQDALAAFVSAIEADPNRVEGPQLTMHEFVREAWPTIEPKDFIDNWHIGCICEHLQGVHVGQIENLAFNFPPGCAKSLVISVLFNGWEWTRQPWLRYLAGSYDQMLSTRDNLRVRELVSSAWYQERWPHVQFKHDQKEKTYFETTRGGFRLATSPGGRGTGHHPHRKILDDPLNARQAESVADREQANNFLLRTLPSRGRALNAATILVMQRLNELDSTQVFLDNYPNVVHVMLPMRFEPQRRCVTVGSVSATHVTTDGVEALQFSAPQTFTDPRTEDGELLHPRLFPKEKAFDSDPYVDAGQMQQRPAPLEGGLFQRAWFQLVDALPSADQIATRGRGWDAAGTEGGGDWTVGARMAITHDGVIYIEDIVREQVGPGDDEKLMRQTADLDLAEVGPGVKHIEEQEPGSAGKKVIASHAKALIGHDYEGEPSTGDKVTRARPFAGQAKAGNVRVLKRGWTKTYLDELCIFPNGAHDDQVDGTTKVFNKIALDVTRITVIKTSGH
jgi:predicted phage terminase large subunit-like protein